MSMKKRKTIYSVILSIGVLLSASQIVRSHPKENTDPSKSGEQIRWLKENGIPIRSIDPLDEDFSDLTPLVKKIGGARIVMLGEASHGDGATFLAKCRLVRFLHQEMGFDVLAWESGLFDCLQMEAALHSEMSIEEAIANAFAVVSWRECGQVLPVFEYARSTYGSSRPLEMAGFDCQLRAYTVERYVKVLFDFLDRADPTLLRDRLRERFQAGFDQFVDGSFKDKSEQRQTFRTTIEELLALFSQNEKLLSQVYAASEIAFYRQTLKNLLINEEVWYQPSSKSRNSQPAGINLRDVTMGENLVWFVRERYKDHKIIVWAHNYHIMRDAPSIEIVKRNESYEGIVPMGQTVYDQLGDEVYTVAFTAYQGKAGSAWTNPWDIQVAEEGSLEHLFHQTGWPYVFVDFRGLPGGGSHWLRQLHLAHPIWYRPMRANWTRVFDSIIFIDNMLPSTWDGTEYATVIGEAKSGQTGKGLPVESALGNWMTDVMRWKTGAQIGLLNSQAINRDIPAGSITKGDIFWVSPRWMWITIPFHKTLVVFSVTGQELRNALEYDVAKGEDRLQFSGLKYKYYPKEVEPYGDRVDYIEINGEVLAKEGKVLWPKKVYTIVSSNYVVKHAEDKYFGFRVNDPVDTVFRLNRALIDWLENYRVLNYKFEGRIVEIDK